MESKVAEILENILGQLSLEGSFDIEEKDDGVFVYIEANDPGQLIGHQGETLSSLQLVINLIVSKQFPDNTKRIILDVAGWRKEREEELAHKARTWAQEVISSGEEKELQPMPSWQRRIVHMTIEQTPGVKSESVGEGNDRHLVIQVDDGSAN
jgi:spoIIIJ-associated protein